MQEVNTYITSWEQELIDLRREFHRHPELGFAEQRTSRRVEEILTELGLTVSRYQETGVVGLLDCGSGSTIALRADLDALPIPEQTKLSYASKQEGVMHACGHDGHTAILLTAAKVLAKFKEQLTGKVKFIFQPAEEGPGGALPLIEAGALSAPDVDKIYGLHINNQLSTGTIGVQPGAASAAADELEIVIEGASGHASTPQAGVDAIVVASQVVTALQSIVSRELDPHQEVVVSLGTIEGGYRRNVIADRVELTGTVRSTDPELRQQLPKKIERIVQGVTAGYGADYQLNYNFGYPVLSNTPELVEEIEPIVEKIPDVSQVKRVAETSLGAEDFAYYLQQVPGVFFRLGAAQPGQDYYSAHHPKFDFDEGALKVGVSLFVYLIFSELNGFNCS